MRLDEIASVIRSKNAGPCLVTFDLIFPDAAAFERAERSLDLIRKETARLYRRAEDAVRVIACRPASAVKITIPRDAVSGDVGDRDVYGAQQHSLLMGIEL